MEASPSTKVSLSMSALITISLEMILSSVVATRTRISKVLRVMKLKSMPSASVFKLFFRASLIYCSFVFRLGALSALRAFFVAVAKSTCTRRLARGEFIN
jgi:hypothetical protein